MMRSNESDKCEAAQEALIALKDAASVPLLIGAVDERYDFWPGCSAARVLGTIGDARALPSLTNAFKAGYEEREVAQALRDIDLEQAIAFFIDELQSNAASAAGELGRIGRAAAPAIPKLIESIPSMNVKDIGVPVSVLDDADASVKHLQDAGVEVRISAQLIMRGVTAGQSLPPGEPAVFVVFSASPAVEALARITGTIAGATQAAWRSWWAAREPGRVAGPTPG